MSRVLVVVAHPDDETLWAGGYLAAHPGTHVLCCSIPRRDPQRIGHFFQACKILGATGWVAGQESYSEKLNTYAGLAFLGQSSFSYDEIVTHNRVGEYGHGAHMLVHQMVEQFCRLNNVPMRVFGYGLTDEGEPIDYETKLRALACYTSRPNVFENQSKRFDLSRECFL